MAKPKKKPAVIKKVAPKKKNIRVKNEDKVAKIVADFRALFDNPDLSKIFMSALTSAAIVPVVKHKDLPADTIGPMVPMDKVPAPVNMVPEVPVPVVVAPPAIVVEDRTTEAVVQVPANPGYRGELLEVATLLGMVNPIACEVVEPQIAEHKAAWGTIAKAKMPNLIVLTGINNSALGGEAKSITYAAYLNDFKSNTRDVLNTFVLKRLTGHQGTKMLAAFNEFRMKNFDKGIAHDGISLGCDPEIFVQNKDGAVIPASNFLGSKEDTNVKTEGAQGGTKVYWDGIQAEFQTRPNNCLAYLVDGIQSGLAATLKAARVVDNDAVLSSKTVMEVPSAFLHNAEDKVVALTCEPSINVYGLKGRTVNPREFKYRPSGGHIHFGLTGKPDNVIADGVKALDAILGVACVSLFRNFDNPIRREFYGLPGEYRLPKWGIEYRTLSSAWLLHPILAHMVFELGRKALMFGINGYRQHWIATDKETTEAIQNCDVVKACAIMERNKDIFKRILSTTALVDPDHKKKTAEIAFNAFMNGCETIIAKPNDVAGNWHLDSKWQAHSFSPNCEWGSAVKEFAKGNKV